jgi:hypothetical protein
MIRRPFHSTHYTTALCVLSAALPALAQSTAPAPTTEPAIQALDRAQLEQERLKKLLTQQAPAYVDKVLSENPGTASTSADTTDAAPQSEGIQTIVVETRFGTTQSQSDGLALRSSKEIGLRTEYRRETQNYGELILQADTRQRSGADAAITYAATEKASGQRITLRSVQLPITTSLFADTVVGHFSSDITDALTRNYRFSLGGSAVQGVGVRLYDSDWDLRLGTGDRGALLGGPYPGFELTQGKLSWAGLSRRWGQGGTLGVQLNQASHVPAVQDGSAAAVLNATDRIASGAASVGYAGSVSDSTDWRLRTSYVQSQAQRETQPESSVKAQGVYLEGGLRLGRYRHAMGLYAAEPGLRFGDYSLPADNRGVYWRVDTSGVNLNWGLGVDSETQNPKRDPERLSSTRNSIHANTQWRIDRNQSLGTQVSFAQTRYMPSVQFITVGERASAQSINLYYQKLMPSWGRSRVSLTVRRSDAQGAALQGNNATATNEVLWEHDWITGRYETLRPEFTTSLGMAQERSSQGVQTYPTAGWMFKHWLDADWSVSGSLRYSLRTGDEATTKGLLGSIDTEWALGQGWRAGASLSITKNTQQINAPAQNPVQSSASKDIALSAYLRWQQYTGKPYTSTGQANEGSAGTGAIAGTVFYDADRDGLQQTTEAGVAGVEVLLDGRYRATTDRNGRFEFQAVTTGRHQLTVRQESVPLPWSTPSQDPLKITIPLRETVNFRIPVTRISD